MGVVGGVVEGMKGEMGEVVLMVFGFCHTLVYFYILFDIRNSLYTNISTTTIEPHPV